MSNIEDIVIIGSGGFAREVAFLIEDINRIQKKWNLLGYVDNERRNESSEYPIVGDDSWLVNYDKPINAVIGVGDPNVIAKIQSRIRSNSNIVFPNLIHPNVICDNSKLTIGSGNIICAGNIFTTNINIGSFNIFNLSNTVGHDSIIGSCNVINPSVNISGSVKIGDNCLLGTSSTILQNVHIVDNVIVGAGAVVVKSIDQAGIYVGVPAKRN